MRFIIGYGLLGYIAFVAIIILGVVVGNILYFNIVKDRISSKRYISFSIGMILNIIICLLLDIAAQYLLYKTFLRYLTNAIDTVVSSFIDLIKLQYILAWFIIPIALVFIYYAILSVLAYMKEYQAWIEWNKKYGDGDEVIDGDPDNNKKKKGFFSSIIPAFKKKELKYELKVNDSELSDIPYTEPLKLMKCSKLSQKGVLQIGKTDKGYVMVVNSKDHENKLKGLIEKFHSVNDITAKMPYIAFFNENELTVDNIKDYGRKILKERRSKK
ncbi:hypothetical protein [Ligilactobacillus salivarius]|uniref:Uncharacterized protein n=1 Tax=Ligilactobacillus salivarius TaxID=1624 RepID=A0A089QGF9_9LACO|nr:hypothetical protein [Ligilactobacillus salivarius]AIR11805.1 Hypothetical protein LSJ_4028 [Ligilactobacillus salivarius]OQQ89351.1 hypothetical protein B6U56_09320 [Ligilactobacillus salivarius]OUQ32001.1 hypothetical protein B5E73_04450 [Ligilactobacillus salivarius]OYP91343.1 hypothetical protein B9G67_05310 [Ligilactobacillus salivarius]